MKKAFLLLVIGLFLLNLFSCTPQALDTQTEAPTACCGDDFTSPASTDP
jgi:hypothetical protein